MNNPYDLHSWSKHYREERLAEASKRHLARRDVSQPTSVTLLVVMLALVAILLAASGCTNSVSPSADAHTASPTPTTSPTATPTASPSSDVNASNYAGMRPSTSWECYTFYSDGTVELRHRGTSTVSDTGSYQGDENFGEMVWGSGRWTSTVVAEGDGLIIDDLKVSPVTSCF